MPISIFFWFWNLVQSTTIEYGIQTFLVLFELSRHGRTVGHCCLKKRRDYRRDATGMAVTLGERAILYGERGVRDE